MRIHSATRPAVAGERSGVTRVLRFLSLALLLAVAGCGGSDDAPAAGAPPTAAPAEASAVIGAAGGTLNGPDGVQLVVPPGALTQDTPCASPAPAVVHRWHRMALLPPPRPMNSRRTG